MHVPRYFTRAVTLVAALLVSTALAACGGAEASGGGEQKTIAFSHAASEAPIAVAVTAAAKARAEELGYRFLSDDPRGDTAVQVKDIENWITQGVDAIVVFPFDPSTVAGLQKRAQDAGIKWITYSAQMPDADGAVLFSHEASGEVIAESVTQWISTQGGRPVKALLLTASALTSVAPRWELPGEAIEAAPNGSVVAEQDALDEATGLRVTEDVLQAHPDLRVVISMNDDSALGALKAFQNAGIPAAESYIAGQDGNVRALEELQTDGHYKATAALRVQTLGQDIANIADRVLNGESDVVIEQTPVLASFEDQALVAELLDEWN
ncbi:sugar ABC transporter substrate-binding protein [Blastococcus sp. CT_GayMR20]|uniref:sugar ABC transporter substrate-binding protein n=1 Tax=Blastococcus sp. CT_GayMR20 TaxID=2559609 RepID=UPI001072FC03|nr:sugar ABC transporter substrate-binding protein [Blastococcus sp. CT_GayMR20]TFV87261.1 sugar ABC transporter substrate-binding protein [Blastococcus sp. CT_GayMR20]TFV87278.1 sugar ABC transporter substrate-binding protein [Blastococcus sp. CT_GayMR20]